MDEGGLNLGGLTFEEYLTKLHSKVVYADCAGEEAYIPSLHHNRLVNMGQFIMGLYQASYFFKIRGEDPITLDSYHKFKGSWKPEEKSIQIKSSDFASHKYPDIAFKDFVSKWASKTPSDYYREAVAQRNELLGTYLPSELPGELLSDHLTPSVDILQEIAVHNHQLHIIHGDPGFGKTIHMQQISERFVRQQRMSEKPAMPVCIKAKHLAASIREHAKEEREINRDPKDITPDDATWKILTYDTTTTLYTIVAKAIQLTNFPYDMNMNDDLLSLFKGNSNGIVYFIDAFDEARELDMPNLVHFISRLTNEASNSVILTNRNSHEDRFGRLWKKMPDRESVNHGIRKYHIDFTPDELRYDMPEKLMAAWEIDGMDVEVQMERNYDEYSKVLTHPLFVGFFAMLVRENQIAKATLSEESENQKQSEVKINGYTFGHLHFLESVIDLGIEKALKDRDYDVSIERMKEIFKAIAYAIHVYNREIPLDNLLLYLEQAAILQLSKDEIRAIKDGVGPLYSTDGTSLQWTHKGMSEIGCSWYISEQPHLYRSNMDTELFMLSQLNNETLTKRTRNRGTAVFDWLLNHRRTSMGIDMILTLFSRAPGDNNWILEEHQKHPNIFEVVLPSKHATVWILRHGGKDALNNWFYHPQNSTYKASVALIEELLMSSDLDRDDRAEDLLELWRERRQKEIAGRENSLARFCTEFIEKIGRDEDYDAPIDVPAFAANERHLATYGHIILNSGHSLARHIVDDNAEYAHLELVRGEDVFWS